MTRPTTSAPAGATAGGGDLPRRSRPMPYPMPPRPWWSCTLRLAPTEHQDAPAWIAQLRCVVRIHPPLTIADPTDVPEVLARLLAEHEDTCAAAIAQQCQRCGKQRAPGNLTAESPTSWVCRDRTACDATIARKQTGAASRGDSRFGTSYPSW